MQLKSLQAKTPVKSPQLSSALCGAGKLYKSDYEVEKCWLEGALANIITNIPMQDETGVSLLEPLSDNLELVKGMIEDLAGGIESAGSNQTLSELQEKVEELKQEWDETSLEENIEAFETSHLGMVENTSYFTAICAGSNAMVISGILTLKELLDKLDFETEDYPDALQEVETETSVIECYAIPTDNKAPLSEEEMRVNAEYIYDYLSEKGGTTEAICGLLGNVQRESKFNPGEWQKKDNENLGYGIVQWSPAYQGFFKWLEEEMGYDMGCYEKGSANGVEGVNNLAENDPQMLLDLQLEYLTFSCKKGVDSDYIQWLPGLAVANGAPYPMSYEEYFNSTLSPSELAVMFEATYERSGDDDNIIQERKDNAEKWYEYFTEREAGE